jgi:hypothetical protein
VNEAVWLACEDPVTLQLYLADTVSNRKGRLYGCAECRLLWDFLYDRASREAVEVAERFADGETDGNALNAANYWAEGPTFGYDFNGMWRDWCQPGEIPDSIRRLVQLGVLSAGDYSLIDTPEAEDVYIRVHLAARVAEMCSVADRVRVLRCFATNKYLDRTRMAGAWLVRDIFGNPFQPVTLDPAWRTSTAVALAQGMYESRDFSAMPILADALQDAGCENPDILGHCRGPGPHVRGCWVVDLVLGKT